MKKLLQSARVPFLVPGLGLYLLGGLWALQTGAGFSLLALVLGYLVVLPAHLSVHFSNDYFDIGSDEPGHSTLISGGGGGLAGHPELRRTVKWIALGLIGFSLIMCAIFIWVEHLPLWVLGMVLLGNLIGWFYSAPPVRLSVRGLGEACYPLLAGFLVPALGYLALKGKLDVAWFFFLIPMLLLLLANVIGVEIPDVEADRRSQRRNWLVRIGRPAAFTIMGVLMLAATGYYFLPSRLVPASAVFQPWLVGVLSLLPLSVALTGMVRRPAERQPATPIAIALVITSTVFILLTDGYLIWLSTL